MRASLSFYEGDKQYAKKRFLWSDYKHENF